MKSKSSGFSIAISIAVFLIFGMRTCLVLVQDHQADEVISKMEKFRDEACECEDIRCGLNSLKVVSEFLEEVEDQQASDYQADMFAGYYKSWEACIEKSGVPLSLFKDKE